MAVGAALRLVGLDWDGGHWLHPDERQIYFTALALAWPQSLADALHPTSSLNPHFFAYGSLPIYLLRVGAALSAHVWPVLRDPDNLHLLGRPLVVLFDLGTVYLTYRLGRTLWLARGPDALRSAPTTIDPAEEVSETDQPQVSLRDGAVAAALFGLSLLPVQLAHFYTADTPLTFFVMLALNLAAEVAQGRGVPYRAALGIAIGLALATKVSALPLVLVAVVAHLHAASTASEKKLAPKPRGAARLSHLSTPIQRGVGTLALALVTFVAVQPYAVIDWPTFLADTLRESQIAWGTLDVPYTRQYAGTLPYLYPIWQNAVWGLGLPLGLVAWAGFCASVVRWLRLGRWADSLLLAWAAPYLVVTGAFHAHPMRYMLPLLPVLCLMAAWLLTSLRSVSLRRAAQGLLLLVTLGYTGMFVSIYSDTHPWIQASTWVYHNVPTGSTLAVEEWDTALPLPLEIGGQARRIGEYDLRTLTLYAEPDDTPKWDRLAADLAASDYLILASQRLYGSIPRLRERYPLASRYYERLLAGDLGFELIQEFRRGPSCLNPPIEPLPGAVPGILSPDESLVVHDHPRALILRNAQHLPPAELIRRLR